MVTSNLDWDSLSFVSSFSEGDDSAAGAFLNKELYYARLSNPRSDVSETMFSFVGLEDSMATCLLNTYVTGIFDEKQLPKKFRTAQGDYTLSESKNVKNSTKYTLERVFGLEDYDDDTIFGNPLKKTDILVAIVSLYDHDPTYLKRIEKKMRRMNKNAQLIVVAVNTAPISSKYPCLEEHKKFFSAEKREEFSMVQMKNVLTEINALAYTKLTLNQSVVSEINRLFSFLLRLGCGVTLGKDTLIRDIEDMGTIPCRKIGVTISHCSNLTPNSELELLDTYVTCQMRMDKKNVKRTKSIKGTINPVFKESFEMNLIDYGEPTCAIEVDVINAERNSKVLGHGVGVLNGLSLQRGVHESIDIDLDTDGKVVIKVVPINFELFTLNETIEMIEIDA